MGGTHITSRKYFFSRRINGLELPLNYLQIFGWTVCILTCLINIIIVPEVQFSQLKLATRVVYAVLYVCHIVSNIFAMGLDPCEEELRKRQGTEVPEFDRNIHSHVIEDGRCHLCNIYTSDKQTKHCGICNKCVYKFDHHCKWLNNCVGRKNYCAFICCVTTALFISLFTCCLCVVDVSFIFQNPLKLGEPALSFINCTSNSWEVSVLNCKYSIYVIIVIAIYFLCSTAITCALLHLLCFHIYIFTLGISTYEYIIRNKSSPIQTRCFQMSNLFFYRNRHMLNRKQRTITKNEPNVANLVSIIVNYELEKARKLFLYERNKIHPTQTHIPS